MSLTLSESISLPQVDGSKSVTLRCVDHLGVKYVHDAMIPGAKLLADYVAEYLARTEAELVQKDLEQAIFGGNWNHTLNHAPLADLAPFVRNAYKNASKEQLAIIANRILEWVANGRFTDVQIRTAFGLNAASYTTLKTKMQNLVTNYSAVNLAVGE